MIRTLIEIIKDHITYRTQVRKLAKSDILRTYRGAALGWLWLIIKPSITIFVFWFAFTVGLRSGSPVNGFPFFLWLLAGIVPWFYMSEMLTQGTHAIRRYHYLVTKMKFPVSTIPTIVAISKFAVHLLLMLIVIAIFGAFGFPPTIYLIQLPFYMLCMFLFFTVLSLLTATMGAISKDFGSLVKSMVTAVFWLSGILFSTEGVTNVMFRRFLMLNPVTFIVDGFRNVFINQTWFFEQPKRLMYFGIVLLITLALAIMSYKKFRKEIPDVL